MRYYEGLSCPVCKESFTEEADVVVCPQCGLPHHRSCWATENHCHEADKHGTPGQWSRKTATNTNEDEPATNNTKVCPRCATVNAEYAEFCTHCGAELETDDWHSAASTPPPPIYEYTPRYAPFSHNTPYADTEIIRNTSAKDLAVVVGNNAAYYLPRFRRTNQKKICGWNWAAFLLGPIWMLYRKQYLSGGFLYILDTACVIIYNLFLSSVQPNTTLPMQLTSQEMMASPWFAAASAASLVLLTMRLVLGFLGNNFYLSSCKKRIQKAKKEIPDISSFELSARGGVSFTLAMVFYFASSFVSNIILTFLL